MANSETTNIGVLYLDSREKGSLLAPHTRTALDTLATEAGVAIENARLYRETLDKARLEHELKIAAEIQKALLPEGNHDGPFFRASGSSVQARSIGGDFFDLIDMPDGGFGFLVGDVAGKGPAAALLTAKILGIFSAFASVGDDPAQTVDHINKVLTRRQIDARYATLLYGQLQPNGKLMFCNGGQNPPLVYGVGGLRRIEAGGMPVGLFEAAPYANDSVELQPGDTMILYSDGVTEAHNVAGDEFGEERMVEVLEGLSQGAGHGRAGEADRRGQGLRHRRRTVRRCDGTGRAVHRTEMTRPVLLALGLWLLCAAVVYSVTSDRQTKAAGRAFALRPTGALPARRAPPLHQRRVPPRCQGHRRPIRRVVPGDRRHRRRGDRLGRQEDVTACWNR